MRGWGTDGGGAATGAEGIGTEVPPTKSRIG
ncbi:DUF6053 domain-containing protein [Lysobacter enzymogenes]